jgi:hypothetical protein
MSHNVKEHIAECYRRAGDYKRLYEGTSKLDERETYFSTRREFLLLAMDLEEKQNERALSKELRVRFGTSAAARQRSTCHQQEEVSPPS